jgi:hypothetical protein
MVVAGTRVRDGVVFRTDDYRVVVVR